MRVSPFESLVHDARQAVRSLRRSRGYVATVIASLALGMGASVAAFGVIDAVRLRALPFPHAERLVVISEVPADGETPAPDCALRCDVQYTTFSQVLSTRTFKTLDAIAGYTTGGKVYMAGGEPVPVSGGVVSPNVFSLMGVQPFMGRALTAEDNQLGVTLATVLSHDMWATLFGGDPNIVGKVVKLSDSRYTVVGVMPPGFDFEAGSKFWLPPVPTLDPSTRPSIRSLVVMGRLAPGRTIAEARAELAAVELPPPAAGKTPLTLQARPLRDRYVASTQSHDVIFAAMVGCLMLLACANLANLSLVRALDQQREFAMRSALGATGARLARELLVQHAVLVVVATGLGLLVARWLFAWLGQAAALASLRPGGMDYQLDGRALAFAALAAVVVGIALSLAPVRLALGTTAGAVLRIGQSAVGKSRAQQGFVVVQVAASFMLLTGGALLAKSARQLATVPVGFDAVHVVQGSPSFPHPWRVREKYLPVTQSLLGQLTTLPGVKSAAVRASLPLRGPGGAPDVVLDGGSAPLPSAVLPNTMLSVSPQYFATMGVPITRGRGFSDADVEQGAPVVIVNAWTARRWWSGQDPVGRTVRVDTAPGKPVSMTVVGVVADNRAAQSGLLLAEPGPELYRPWVQAPSAFPQFVVSTSGNAANLLKPVRDVLVRGVPDRPLSTSLVANTIADQLAGVRANAVQALWVAAVGLFLALLGVHGVLSHAVRRRTREIGIRAAMGATSGHIVVLVLRQVAMLVAIGLVIGIPAARATSRLIEGLLTRTSATDPIVYAMVAVAVLFTAVLAAALPLLHALRVQPLEALRSERAS
ncbi:MAG: ABC transporter permease [Cytophagaceae bacterium]|nr:ABC transporter permease [Gemmatimonadaceae bacterium]